ncbi:unnamed protein product [Acidocella sp. C78]|nr:unnamed protein product [Acidocella sp. C78]
MAFDPRQQGGDLAMDLPLVEHRHQAHEAPHRLAAKEDVGAHIEMIGKGEILIDRLDPGIARIARRAERHLLAAEPDRAGIGPVHAGNHLHQGGLAGPVVANHAEHLAGGHFERHAAQHLDRAEPLVDAAHLEGGHAHAVISVPTGAPVAGSFARIVFPPSAGASAPAIELQNIDMRQR